MSQMPPIIREGAIVDVRVAIRLSGGWFPRQVVVVEVEREKEIGALGVESVTWRTAGTYPFRPARPDEAFAIHDFIKGIREPKKKERAPRAKKGGREEFSIAGARIATPGERLPPT